MVRTKTHPQPPFPLQHGGDSGTGRVVAVLFAREGAGVAIVCLPEEESNARTTGRGGREWRANGAAPTKRPAQP